MRLETDRLLLRQWQPSDFEPFAKLNADPEVRRYFPNAQSVDESNVDAQTCYDFIDQKGWGFWAVEIKKTSEFIGFVGLYEPTSALPFSPCVEIGWRLSKDYWGNGYATEAGVKALSYAFDNLDLDQVVALTAVENIPSRAVMDRLGMHNTKQNFFHPDIAPEHELSEHVLYTITKKQWQR